MGLPLFISTAEAAFIAGLSDRQMHRVVDERLLPETLFEQRGGRGFTRLGAAFATFYFATDSLLVSSARRQVLEELAARVEALPSKEGVLSLTVVDAVSWTVLRPAVAVDVTSFVQAARVRAQEVSQADSFVSADPAILAGTPVFTGSRVPIDIVLGSLAAGIDLERLQSSYPFLTPAHLQAAQVFEAVHPRRGRPRRIVDAHPDLTPRRVTRIDKRAAAA